MSKFFPKKLFTLAALFTIALSGLAVTLRTSAADLLDPTTTYNVTPSVLPYPTGRTCEGGTLIGGRFNNISGDGAVFSETYLIDGTEVTITITTYADNSFDFAVSGGTVSRFFAKGGSLPGGGSAFLLYQYDPPVAGATNSGPVTEDTGLHAGRYQAISHLDFCLNPGIGDQDALSAEKTAEASFDRTVEWELSKTVVPTSHTGTAGNVAGSSTWTVVATKNETLGNYQVTGTVTVSNTNNFAVPFTVDDYLNDGDDTAEPPVPPTRPDVICPGSEATPNSGTAPAGSVATPGTIVCTYSVTVADATADTNTAVVTPDDNEIGGDTATANVIFVENLIGDDEVTLGDDRNPAGFPVVISDSTTVNYDETFTCSSTLGDYTNGSRTDVYPNTATLDGPNTDEEASASVSVTCTVPFVGETATGQGPRWPGTANWFMYSRLCTDATATTPSSPLTVNLIAGQHYDAGDATVAACGGSGNTTLTITLQNGFKWADVGSNLKVEPMNSPPTKYKQPGAFAKKFTVSGNTVSVTVPKAKYYGIHADVLRPVIP